MNVLIKKPGIMLIEQYGNTYIRYVAGEIADYILQIRISEDERTQLLSQNITMESVLNFYDNQNKTSASELQSSLIKDYLLSVDTYSDQRMAAILSKLQKYGDIFFEFYDFVLYERFTEDGIVIEGYTAQKLADNFQLSPLGAYNYLIYLREMPGKALADLKAGLPTKDTNKIGQIAKQEEEKKNMNKQLVPPGKAAEKPQQISAETHDSQREFLAKLDALQQAMADLQQTFDDKIAEDTHKNGLFDNMHRELIRYQNGAMDKIVDTMALDIIQLVDTTKGHVRVYEKKEPTEDNYKRLLRIVKGIAEDLQDILYRQNIEAYRVEGHEVDVRRQKIIQTVPIDDQSKDNLVAVRVADGYEKDGKVLRPERIKIFKYSPITTDKTEN